jgi:Mlc titration factor MtfA (ptsG expression regulator)
MWSSMSSRTSSTRKPAPPTAPPNCTLHRPMPAGARCWGAAFEQLQQRTQQGLAGVLDSYGASNPAEFFAVVSEAFFLQPGALANEHPDLFDELRRFYCIDPLTW